jgi:hypothetical protein
METHTIGVSSLPLGKTTSGIAAESTRDSEVASSSNTNESGPL